MTFDVEKCCELPHALRELFKSVRGASGVFSPLKLRMDMPQFPGEQERRSGTLTNAKEQSMANNTSHVVWFEELRRADVPRVGGKNASLGEMVANLRPVA